jgi:hypothetical protein
MADPILDIAVALILGAGALGPLAYGWRARQRGEQPSLLIMFVIVLVPAVIVLWLAAGVAARPTLPIP